MDASQGITNICRTTHMSAPWESRGGFELKVQVATHSLGSPIPAGARSAGLTAVGGDLLVLFQKLEPPHRVAVWVGQVEPAYHVRSPLDLSGFDVALAKSIAQRRGLPPRT